MKKKFKDTKVGKFLIGKGGIFQTLSNTIPDKGLLGVLKGLISKDDTLTPKDKETALKEFKTHLKKTWGGDVESLEYRYIDMRCGIHERLFEKNVVAIGLSAGFIEPLESNGLFSVHEFLVSLARNIRRGEITQWDRDNHTFACKAIYHGFEEFVGLHYAMSTRNDTPYWKANNNKVWEESLRSMKPKMFLGYLQAALQRAKYYEFPVDPVERKGNSGLHFIAAGCNWAPDDLVNSVYTTHKTKEEILSATQQELANFGPITDAQWRVYADQVTKPGLDYIRTRFIEVDTVATSYGCKAINYGLKGLFFFCLQLFLKMVLDHNFTILRMTFFHIFFYIFLFVFGYLFTFLFSNTCISCCGCIEYSQRCFFRLIRI